jgi:hypothetical protein
MRKESHGKIQAVCPLVHFLLGRFAKQNYSFHWASKKGEKEIYYKITTNPIPDAMTIPAANSPINNPIENLIIKSFISSPHNFLLSSPNLPKKIIFSIQIKNNVILIW